MSTRPIRFLAALVAIAACGPVSNTAPRTASEVPPPRQPRADLDAAGRGMIVFENACSRCHGLDAPAESAPDIRVVARRYRAELADETAVAERVAAWIGAPSPDRKLLPESAIEHWGLMPRLALDRDLALDVGHYIWSLGAADTGTARPN